MSEVAFPIRGQLLSMHAAIRAHLAHVVSPFQTIDIYDTEAFGKILFLDGHVQLAQLDERAYHECLVRVPLLNLPHAKSALIVGGGDGGALRELCRFSHLERIEMVEIDRAVIDTCLAHLPELSAGAYEDPRVKLHVADAFDFVRNHKAVFDLIVLDSTDTYEDETGELSEALFTSQFYEDCKQALRPGGLVVTQADNPVFCPYSLSEIRAEYGKVFGAVGDYFGMVPSFGGYSAFCFAGESPAVSSIWQQGWQEGTYLNAATYNLAFRKPAFR